MAPEVEVEAFTLDQDGLPTGKLKSREGELSIRTARGWVNPRSRNLYKLGIFVFAVRGTSYHQDALKSGSFRPGVGVILKREPENEHDPNAVAVCNRRGKVVGYVNKLNAARLAKLIDQGVELEAISLRGSKANSDYPEVPRILVTTPEKLAHLRQR